MKALPTWIVSIRDTTLFSSNSGGNGRIRTSIGTSWTSSIFPLWMLLCVPAMPSNLFMNSQLYVLELHSGFVHESCVTEDVEITLKNVENTINFSLDFGRMPYLYKFTIWLKYRGNVFLMNIFDVRTLPGTLPPVHFRALQCLQIKLTSGCVLDLRPWVSECTINFRGEICE